MPLFFPLLCTFYELLPDLLGLKLTETAVGYLRLAATYLILLQGVLALTPGNGPLADRQSGGPPPGSGSFTDMLTRMGNS